MRVVNIYKESYSHYIGRPGPLSNIFHIGKDGTREDVIRKFEEHARYWPGLMDKIKALPEDAILGCYCNPLPCHGDIIVKLWKEIHGQTCEDEGCPHYGTPHGHKE